MISQGLCESSVPLFYLLLERKKEEREKHEAGRKECIDLHVNQNEVTFTFEEKRERKREKREEREQNNQK